MSAATGVTREDVLIASIEDDLEIIAHFTDTELLVQRAACLDRDHLERLAGMLSRVCELLGE